MTTNKNHDSILDKSQSTEKTTLKKKRRGPPNRMNDLVYRDWMKFQKSFFWYTSDTSLYSEFIRFFTKEILPCGSASRSLVRGRFVQDTLEIKDNRRIDVGTPWNGGKIQTVSKATSTSSKAKHEYNFIMVDLRDSLTDGESVTQFLKDSKRAFFSELKELLASESYCAFLVPACDSQSFPIAWSFAFAGRAFMRLRDEKIALLKENAKDIFYCIIFQNNSDTRTPTALAPSTLVSSEHSMTFKSWIIPKPPPRKKNEVLHPAKYPETLIQYFIETFTNPGDTVLDPMVGTGSTVIAALRCGRNAIGIELSKQWAEIAQDRINFEIKPSFFDQINDKLERRIICDDVRNMQTSFEIEEGSVDYVVTSPPYWSMLKNPGSENQKSRKRKNLSLVYSDNDADLGNVLNYDEFLEQLTDIYASVANTLKPQGVMTVIVKNVKRNHVVYPLAWDLVAKLCSQDGKFRYIGNTLWCQDDIGLKPFGVGIVWVSNIVHQYCLHFMRR